MATRFQKYLSKFGQSNPTLPLIHTATTSDFRKILSKDTLTATEDCDVFGEPLIYLFYGRPAYKVRVDQKNQRVADEYMPVALVFHPDASADFVRAFPFDSGAFNGGFYRSIHHEDFEFADFALNPSLVSARSTVKAFFGNNANYVLGEASRRRPQAFDEPEAHSHFALIAGPNDLTVDDRRYTIELQTLTPLDLSHVLAVVMPHTWLRSKTVTRFLKRHPQVEPLTYAKFLGSSVSASHAVIFEQVREFLGRRGFLTESKS